MESFKLQSCVLNRKHEIKKKKKKPTRTSKLLKSQLCREGTGQTGQCFPTGAVSACGARGKDGLLQSGSVCRHLQCCRAACPLPGERPFSAQGWLCTCSCSSPEHPRSAQGSLARLPSSNVATPSGTFQRLESLLSGQGHQDIFCFSSQLCVGLHAATGT